MNLESHPFIRFFPFGLPCSSIGRTCEMCRFESDHGNSNMINSVKSDFSVMPRCNGNEIGLFEILDKLILSAGSDSIGEDGNRQQCLAVYHHREVNSRLLVVGYQ